MGKKETQLFNIAKKIRNISYRLTNFFKYRLLVNAKHILIIGGDGTYLKQEIVQNFQDTWRIANISKETCNISELNININESQLTIQRIEEISNQVQQFSKHYECILCIPDTDHKIGDFSDINIFTQLEQHTNDIINPSLLATHLATKYLTNNGIVFFKGDQQSFDGPLSQMPSYSTIMNQVHYINLVAGERDDINIDAFSNCLLERDILLDDIKIKNLQEQQNEQSVKENDKQVIKKENLSKGSKEESKQLAQMIRVWAEDSQRPLSGAFIKFKKQNDQIFPELY